MAKPTRMGGPKTTTHRAHSGVLGKRIGETGKHCETELLYCFRDPWYSVQNEKTRKGQAEGFDELIVAR